MISLGASRPQVSRPTSLAILLLITVVPPSCYRSQVPFFAFSCSVSNFYRRPPPDPLSRLSLPRRAQPSRRYSENSLPAAQTQLTASIWRKEGARHMPSEDRAISHRFERSLTLSPEGGLGISFPHLGKLGNLVQSNVGAGANPTWGRPDA